MSKTKKQSIDSEDEYVSMTSDESFYLFIGLVAGFVIGMFVMALVLPTNSELAESKADYGNLSDMYTWRGEEIFTLGSAICDQEYNRDFGSYTSEQGLECVERIVKLNESMMG